MSRNFLRLLPPWHLSSPVDQTPVFGLQSDYYWTHGICFHMLQSDSSKETQVFPNTVQWFCSSVHLLWWRAPWCTLRSFPPNVFWIIFTDFASSGVNRPSGISKRNTCGPGSTMEMQLVISLWISSLVSPVSNSPGVSITVMCRPLISTVSLWVSLVTEWKDSSAVNAFLPKTVFPVALFPTPVFPSNTILSSSGLSFEPVKEEMH